MRPLSSLPLALLAAFTVSIQAHDHGHHGSNAPAHQHGVGQLHLVIEQDQLHLELQVPADDLLGFEHAPSTAEQHAALAALQETLQQPERLFRLPAPARCELEASELHSSLFAPADPAIEHGRHGEHADISARYQFRCAAMSRLQQLEILVFDLFPDSQRLVLQAITPKGQTGAELTAKRNLVDL